MKKYNELPTHFKSWCEFFNAVENKVNELNTKVICYHYYDSEIIWQVEVDYMKARCFEEFKKHYPKISNGDYKNHAELIYMLRKFENIVYLCGQ